MSPARALAARIAPAAMAVLLSLVTFASLAPEASAGAVCVSPGTSASCTNDTVCVSISSCGTTTVCVAASSCGSSTACVSGNVCSSGTCVAVTACGPGVACTTVGTCTGDTLCVSGRCDGGGVCVSYGISGGLTRCGTACVAALQDAQCGFLAVTPLGTGSGTYKVDRATINGLVATALYIVAGTDADANPSTTNPWVRACADYLCSQVGVDVNNIGACVDSICEAAGPTVYGVAGLVTGTAFGVVNLVTGLALGSCVSASTCRGNTICVSTAGCENADTACITLGTCTCNTYYSWYCSYDGRYNSDVCVAQGTCEQHGRGTACVSLTACPSSSTYAVANAGGAAAGAAGQAVTFDAATLRLCVGSACQDQSTLVRLATDTDGDGYGNADEASGNSDPTNPASTPLTDDDCDGKANSAETDLLSALGVAHPAVAVVGGGVSFDPVTLALSIDPPTVNVVFEGASSC